MLVVRLQVDMHAEIVLSAQCIQADPNILTYQSAYMKAAHLGDAEDVVPGAERPRPLDLWHPHLFWLPQQLPHTRQGFLHHLAQHAYLNPSSKPYLTRISIDIAL